MTRSLERKYSGKQDSNTRATQRYTDPWEREKRERLQKLKVPQVGYGEGDLRRAMKNG